MGKPPRDVNPSLPPADVRDVVSIVDAEEEPTGVDILDLSPLLDSQTTEVVPRDPTDDGRSSVEVDLEVTLHDVSLRDLPADDASEEDTAVMDVRDAELSDDDDDDA